MSNDGCNSCASLAELVLCFIACFLLLVIAPLPSVRLSTVGNQAFTVADSRVWILERPARRVDAS